MAATGRRRKVKPRPPADPTSLSVTQPTASTALLLWTDNSRDEAVFEVERRVVGSETLFTLLASLAQNTVTYTDTGLLEGTTYQYRVRAANDEGISAYTNTVSLTTASTAPPPPAPATAPTAALSVTTSPVTLGTAVRVSTVGTIPGSGTLTAWSLNWGDGTPATTGDGTPTATLTHTYTAVGSYTLTLTVNDTNSLSDDATASASVIAAPPIPVPSTTLASPVFTSTGWATMALVLPSGDLPSGQAVKIGALTTQTNVLRTWGDGSAKHLLATANITSTGTHTVTAIADPGGSLTPTWPSASVTFTISGTAYTATLPAFDGTDTRCNGALMREARVKVTPTTSGAVAHPLLRVWFDVRSYNGGGHVVDIAVNNVLDKSGGGSVTYDVSISVAGSTVYTKSSFTHYYLTRWRKRFTTGLTEAGVTPDFTSLFEAKALPEYSSLVGWPGSASVAEQTNTFTDSKYDIGDYGGMLSNMGEAGWRPEISTPYPDWVARYLVHKHPGSLSQIKKMADLMGSWSGHITNTDNTFITLTQSVHYWLDAFGRSTAPNGPVSVSGYTAFMENAHFPQLVAPAYILTGDRYYADELAFCASANVLMVWFGDDSWYGTRAPGGVATGLFMNDQVRGWARGLMSVQDAAAYLPTGHELVTYLTNIVTANISWLDADCGFRTGGPFTYASYNLLKYNPGTDHPDWQASVPWQDSFVCLMCWKARRHGLTTTQGNTFMSRIGTMWKTLFSYPGWPLEYAAQTRHLSIPAAAGATDFSNPYATTSRVFSEDVAAMKAIHDQLGPQGTPFAGYYDVDARQGLLIGAARGIDTSAQVDLLMRQSGVLEDLAYRAGHYITNVTL